MLRDDPDLRLPRSVLRELARGGDFLSSAWTPVTVGALGLALLVVMVLRRRHSRRRWPWAVSGGVVVVLALALTANTISGYVPNVQSLQTTMSGWGLAPAPFTHHGHAAPEAAGPGQGGVGSYLYTAPVSLRMPNDRSTWVYTPPGYDPDASTRYPVVYLVHGSPGSSGDWFAAGDAPHAMNVLLANHLVRPMIVVSVDVNGIGDRDTECLNSQHGGSQVETYLYQVIVPWVDATFRTWPDAAHRALGGFSSGGYCALDQGLRHPTVWGTVLSLDGYPNPGQGGRAELDSQQDWLRYDVTRYAATMPVDPHQHLLVALEDDTSVPAVRGVREVAATLTKRGADVTVRMVRGLGHTWTMARVELPYALRYYSLTLG